MTGACYTAAASAAPTPREPISRPKWNRLRDEMLLRIIQARGMLRESPAPAPGRHQYGCGAQVLGMSLDIGITWRRKEGAAHPGERARIIA